VFFEQQSTPSKNMPLRLLRYVTDVLYSQIVDLDRLYGSAQVMIPAPKFYVLYNGEQKLQERVIKLSDAFLRNDTEPALELTAKVIDINIGSGESALGRSASLKGYSFLIAEIRRNQSGGMPRDAAITTAMDLCIRQDILKTYLEDHYSEVIKMLNYEYDADAERRVIRQESFEEGIEKGIKKGIKKGRQEGIKKGRQEGQQEGRQEVIDLIAKLLKEGLSPDEAIVSAKKVTKEIKPA